MKNQLILCSTARFHVGDGFCVLNKSPLWDSVRQKPADRCRVSGSQMNSYVYQSVKSPGAIETVRQPPLDSDGVMKGLQRVVPMATPGTSTVTSQPWAMTPHSRTT